MIRAVWGKLSCQETDQVVTGFQCRWCQSLQAEAGVQENTLGPDASCSVDIASASANWKLPHSASSIHMKQVRARCPSSPIFESKRHRASTTAAHVPMYCYPEQSPKCPEKKLYDNEDKLSPKPCSNNLNSPSDDCNNEDAERRWTRVHFVAKQMHLPVYADTSESSYSSIESIPDDTSSESG